MSLSEILTTCVKNNIAVSIEPGLMSFTTRMRYCAGLPNCLESKMMHAREQLESAHYDFMTNVLHRQLMILLKEVEQYDESVRRHRAGL